MNNLLDATFANHEFSRDLWLRSVSPGLYKDFERVENRRPLVDLHEFSKGADETAASWWLEKMRSQKGSLEATTPEVVIVTGKGLHRPWWSSSDVRARVSNFASSKNLNILGLHSLEKCGALLLIA